MAIPPLYFGSRIGLGALEFNTEWQVTRGKCLSRWPSDNLPLGAGRFRGVSSQTSCASDDYSRPAGRSVVGRGISIRPCKTVYIV